MTDPAWTKSRMVIPITRVNGQIAYGFELKEKEFGLFLSSNLIRQVFLFENEQEYQYFCIFQGVVVFTVIEKLVEDEEEKNKIKVEMH